MAGYIRSCIDYFLEKNVKAQVMLVRYEVNNEAPFNFSSQNNLTEIIYKPNSGCFLENIKNFGPDILLCSGWSNTDYLKIARYYYKKIPTVLCFDNAWKGTYRQYLAASMSGLLLRNKFSICWVPGKEQHAFASRLGYSEKRIFEGFYCADTTLYNEIYNERARISHSREKVFISIARYIPEKNLSFLWKVFSRFSELNPEAQLWCFGHGKDFENRYIHPSIKHFGFIQPENMKEYLLKADFFILSSIIEPWGVVVHEMASAGLPLILSDKVGSASMFLEEGKNGFSFESNSEDALFKCLKKSLLISENEKNEFSKHSHLLSQKVTLEKWNQTLKILSSNFN